MSRSRYEEKEKTNSSFLFPLFKNNKILFNMANIYRNINI